MLEVLRETNQKLIIKYQNDKSKLDRQLLIYNILKKDDCFFEITIEDSYNILKDLEIENYEECYKELISYLKYSAL